MNKNQKIYRETNRLWWMYRIVYGVAFIGSGLDKFFNFLINWHMQDLPYKIQFLGISSSSLLHVRGFFEIIIGIMLFTRWVKSGAYLSCFWLLLSAVYIFFVPNHFDTAMRYAVVSLGAYALGRLTFMRELES